MPTDAARLSAFIETWERSGAAERANYQLFLCQLCDLLEVGQPEPAKADASLNSYIFEHPVVFDDGLGHTTTKFIDLYKRGYFVLEAKQGSDRDAQAESSSPRPNRRSRRGTAVRGTQGWDDAMLAARGQAELYAKALPVGDGWPPFLVIVDVGHSIELFADFSRSGKTYTAFPDARTHRIPLKDLAKEAIRERLRLVWSDPLALDPSSRSAKVTRAVAKRLAELAKSLERTYEPSRVASFLMRCLFTMFAEDIELLPKDCFKTLLKNRVGKVETFPSMVGSLWAAMDKGDFSPILEKKSPWFNGELFANAEALPLDEEQLGLLIEAAEADWKAVEPAIFGTLLERALDPLERHKLGAHFTPRSYVERLVLPTIIEPLREEWASVQAAAVTLAKANKLEDAKAEVRDFLAKLCKVTVLDPACGTGNFLYVTLEHLKRLEGEIRDTLRGFGERQEVFEGIGLTVDPHQLLGIELNPRAAAIAELVLWIGYLQWHFRTFGARMPAEPIIKAFHNIEGRDALFVYDRKELLLGEDGQPKTHWDGITKKIHPTTGEEVPDESAQVPDHHYINPKEADWPKADFIVGNPPFIGIRKVRLSLGDGYVEALRAAFSDVPETCDFVMYWWFKAARLVRAGKLERFGFITTNSITQTFNRAIVQASTSDEENFSLVFAIPDHPWVKSEDGAAVRIAMTVGERGIRQGIRATVTEGEILEDGEREIHLRYQKGRINADLTVGVDVRAAKPLRSNEDLCLQGCKLVGAGFLAEEDERARLIERQADAVRFLPRYVTGSHIVKKPKTVYVIDLFGLTSEAAREQFPEGWQIVHDRVKPERDHNRRPTRRRNWWLFGENAPKLRRATRGLRRFIATSEVAKHRIFVFLDMPGTVADGSLAAIAHEDAFVLGVLSSRVHVKWSLASGGRMGAGNDPRYQNGPCFDPFPFPDCPQDQKNRIRELAESLDAHRKRRQAQFPSLALTDVYNVLEKVRLGQQLDAAERQTHEQGLVSVLKQIHDDLDEAVFSAYGWPVEFTDEEILEGLVTLNAERVAEEAEGKVRWLRPDIQRASEPTQATLAIEEADEDEQPLPKSKKKKVLWPKALSEQAQAIRASLKGQALPVTAQQLARTFERARLDRVEELLETLVSLGQARELSDGRFVPAPTARST